MITEEEFIQCYVKINTQKAYKQALQRFKTKTNIKPSKLIQMPPEHIEIALRQYLIKSQDKTPKTCSLTIKVINQFLKRNGINIDIYHLKDITRNIKDRRPATSFRTFTSKQLKEILQHANLKDKALIMLLATSGIRINEALQIKVKDIDFKFNPTLINIKASVTKSGYPRTTFITSETTEVIKQWIQFRKQYIKEANKKNYSKKNKDNKEDKGRLFPYSYGTAISIWLKLLKKAKFDKRDDTTNFHQYKLHGLRAYFRTQISTEISQDIIDTLMGHETELTRAYRNITEETLGEQYKKAEHKLTIFESLKDFSELQEEIEIIKKENLEIKMKYNQLATDLYERIHQFPDTDMDYYELKEIQILPNSELFIDIDKDTGETYVIRDEERIKALKEYYKDDIKEARKNKAKSIRM
ncbi:MAG: site-specific integrase [Candidatus Thermoplasmatota archaeon]|nr:site-specific integrase [Candidatus Thermoplasmatota archaeon]